MDNLHCVEDQVYCISDIQVKRLGVQQSYSFFLSFILHYQLLLQACLLVRVKYCNLIYIAKI